MYFSQVQVAHALLLVMVVSFMQDCVLGLVPCSLTVSVTKRAVLVNCTIIVPIYPVPKGMGAAKFGFSSASNLTYLSYYVHS